MDLWLAGLLGGCASEVLKWFRIREELHKGLPDYAKSWSYWIVTTVMAAMGGLLVFMYQASEDVNLSPILAFNIGASAPLILGTLVGQVPGSIAETLTSEAAPQTDETRVEANSALAKS